MGLTNDELLAGLKEAGHTEAATALEQKMNVQAAAGGGGEDAARKEPASEAPEMHGPARMARAYDARAAAGEAGGEGGGGE